MKAIVILPEAQEAAFLANFIDRPFLRHVIEFLDNQGIGQIVLVGAAAGQEQVLQAVGNHWAAAIAFQKASSTADFNAARITGGEACVLACAMCLPVFSLRQSVREGGAVVYGASGWTGWALVESKDIGAMPPLCEPAAVLPYLQGLTYYSKLSANPEFHCETAADLWRSHKCAQDSNLSAISHNGLEKPSGVWIGRNVSIDAGARITPPVYIGQNSRIGSGVRLGPFAVIGKDCLIAPRTIVRNAVIAPGTYAASDLELDHVFADKRHLFDVRSGAPPDFVDSAILDGVFDFHWSAIPRRIRRTVMPGFIWVSNVLSSRRQPERANAKLPGSELRNEEAGPETASAVD